MRNKIIIIVSMVFFNVFSINTYALTIGSGQFDLGINYLPVSYVYFSHDLKDANTDYGMIDQLTQVPFKGLELYELTHVSERFAFGLGLGYTYNKINNERLLLETGRQPGKTEIVTYSCSLIAQPYINESIFIKTGLCMGNIQLNRNGFSPKSSDDDLFIKIGLGGDYHMSDAVKIRFGVDVNTYTESYYKISAHSYYRMSATQVCPYVGIYF